MIGYLLLGWILILFEMRFSGGLRERIGNMSQLKKGVNLQLLRK